MIESSCGETVSTLFSNGIKTVSHLKNCPAEVLHSYMAPDAFGAELILINCSLAALREEVQQSDPTAMAMRKLAHEQRAQRKRRQG